MAGPVDMNQKIIEGARRALKGFIEPPPRAPGEPVPTPAYVNDLKFDWKFDGHGQPDPHRSTFSLRFTNGISIEAPVAAVKIDGVVGV